MVAVEFRVGDRVRDEGLGVGKWSIGYVARPLGQFAPGQ